MNNRWKYQVTLVKAGWVGCVGQRKLQEELERQGSLGWELVQILRSQGTWGSAQLVFKRPA